MRKLLFFSPLAIMLFTQMNAFGQQGLHPDYSLTVQDKIDLKVYTSAIQDLDQPIEILCTEELKLYLLATLGERLPELSYVLQRSPDYLINEPNVIESLIEVLKEDAALGISAENNPTHHAIKGKELSKKDLASIEFLYGYDQFKKKKYQAALKSFSSSFRARNEDFDFAAYYAGLSAIMINEYDKATTYLSKIGSNERLRKHAPYYLALSHYALKEYEIVSKYYSNRIHENQLFNIQGIISLVALSQYHTAQHEASLKSLAVLKQHRNLTSDEQYIQGICEKKQGKHENSLTTLSNISGSQQLNNSVTFEKAMTLYQQGKYREALELFENLASAEGINPHDFKWNQLIVNHKMGNYDKAAMIALQEFILSPNQNITEYLITSLAHLEKIDLIQEIATTLSTDDQKRNTIRKILLDKALAALQDKNKIKAIEYFNLVEKTFPRIEEHAEVAAWKGLMAYEDKNFSSAKELLQKYNQSKSSTTLKPKLDFDANYILAYSYLKEKQLPEALQQFGVAFKLFKLDHTPKEKQEDILTRMGDIYLQHNDYTNALDAYTKALALDLKQQDYLLYQSATIAELQQRPYDALLTLDELVSNHYLSRYKEKSTLMSGNILFGLGKLDKSAHQYKKLLQAETTTEIREEAILALGLLNVNAGDYREAEKWYKQITASSTIEDNKRRAHEGLKEIYSDYTYDTEAFLKIAQNQNTGTSLPKDSVLYSLAVKFSEGGQENKALENYNHIISDFTTSRYYAPSLFDASNIQLKNKKSISSIENLELLIALPTNSYTIKAFDLYQEITWTMLEDYTRYEILEEKRVQNFPNEELTLLRRFRSAIANLKMNRIDNIATAYSVLDLNLNDSQLSELSEELINFYVNKSDWKNLISTLSHSEIKARIKKPKYSYYKALAHFNLEQFDETISYITSHYETLLSDPAWFAKSIILLADAYSINGDHISTRAALTALVESESSIPASVKELAAQRLELLKLSN